MVRYITAPHPASGGWGAFFFSLSLFRAAGYIYLIQYTNIIDDASDEHFGADFPNRLYITYWLVCTYGNTLGEKLKLEKRNGIRIGKKMEEKNMKIEMPNKMTIKCLRYTHSMTTNATFHQVFKETGQNHMRYYIEEQWTLWLASPLAFMRKWPVQANALVVRYAEANPDDYNL